MLIVGHKVDWKRYDYHGATRLVGASAPGSRYSIPCSFRPSEIRTVIVEAQETIEPTYSVGAVLASVIREIGEKR
jgi:hypothetical protein